MFVYFFFDHENVKISPQPSLESPAPPETFISNVKRIFKCYRDFYQLLTCFKGDFVRSFPYGKRNIVIDEFLKFGFSR